MSDSARRIAEYAALRVQRAEMQWGYGRPDWLRGDDRNRFDRLSDEAASLWVGFGAHEKREAAERYFEETRLASNRYGRK